MSMKLLVILVVVALCLELDGIFSLQLNEEASKATPGQLYGYTRDPTTHTGQLYSIHPSTGATSHVCTLPNAPYALLGSSQSVYVKGGLLLYTTQNHPPSSSAARSRDPTLCAPSDAGDQGYLVTVDPKTCKQSLIAVGTQPKEANVVKYDNLKNTLYMAFQNPECMHSSLDVVELRTGKILKHLNNIVLNEGGNQKVAMDAIGQTLYYISETFTGFDITKVRLNDGNMTNVHLNFLQVGGGVQWMTNAYTIQYLSGKLIGIAAFSNVSSPCHPAGVFTVTIPKTGSAVMQCVLRLPQTTGYVNEISDSNPALGYYYQVLDNKTLVTYDVVNSKLLYSVRCPLCNSFEAISFLPSSSAFATQRNKLRN